MKSGLTTLSDVLKGGRVYTSREIESVFYELAHGFSVLQAYGIVNRDVKPQTFLWLRSMRTISIDFPTI